MSPRPLPSPDAPFEPALALARDGQFVEALRALSDTIAVVSTEGEGRAAAALAFAQVARFAEGAGAPDHALDALDAALALAPGYADLHYRRGCLLVAAHRRAEGRRALDRALEINPRYVAALVDRAMLDAREGLLGEALASLRALDEERRVEEPRAFQQGLRSLERADWDEAGALLKQALRLPDPGIEQLIARHRTLMSQGDHAHALHSLREAVTSHPGYPDLHYMLGCCELELGVTDDALASLARALELNPDYHAARVAFARALESLGDLVQAGEQVALVLEADPSHAQALQLEQRWSRRRSPSRADAGARKPS